MRLITRVVVRIETVFGFSLYPMSSEDHTVKVLHSYHCVFSSIHRIGHGSWVVYQVLVISLIGLFKEYHKDGTAHGQAC